MTKPVQMAESDLQDPWLLTPGPLTTSLSVKEAMLHDFGSRDARFIEINRQVREKLLDIIDGHGTHECVPLQGSGTFVVEAMLVNFVPPEGKVLVLINGAYGKRIAKICEYHGRQMVIREWPENQPVDGDEVDRLLEEQEDISHVAVIHCETTTGILNPLQQISDIVEKHKRSLLVDSMSAFGALSIDSKSIRFDALVASSNKCLEGVPGMGFCLARREALEQTRGNSDSLCLDLFDQWSAMEANSQWRFTPPVHCILAMHRALVEFEEEGGVQGRGGRYSENYRVQTEGMRELGYETLLPDVLQAPIIITYKMPADPAFDFNVFYQKLSQRGYVIYPGKLTVADSFRMGCIGRLDANHMRGAIDAVKQVMQEMNITSGAPET